MARPVHATRTVRNVHGNLNTTAWVQSEGNSFYGTRFENEHSRSVRSAEISVARRRTVLFGAYVVFDTNRPIVTALTVVRYSFFLYPSECPVQWLKIA